MESAAAPVETDAKKTAGLFAGGALEVPKGLDAERYRVRVDVGDKAQLDTPRAWAVGESDASVAVGGTKWSGQTDNASHGSV
jgi:hypothetical protein